jgi:hypothetical protein
MVSVHARLNEGWWIAGSVTSNGPRPEINSTLPEQLMKDMKTVKDQNWGRGDAGAGAFGGDALLDLIFNG